MKLGRMKCWFDLLLEPLRLHILIEIWGLHRSTVFLIDQLEFLLLFQLLVQLFKMFSSFVVFVLLINDLLFLVQNSFHLQVLNLLFHL